MSETVELQAYERTSAGKANRRLAGEGRVPGVVYGPHIDTQAVALDRHALELLLTREGVGAMIIRLGLKSPIDTVIKSVQTDPLKGTVRHIDFYAISMNEKVSAQAPVHFVGDSAGVRAGGVLMHNTQALHIQALPADLPDAIDVDVTGLEVGDSLTIGQLTLPRGVSVLDDADGILCSVTPPTVAPSAEESAAAQQPEVIGAEEEES